MVQITRNGAMVSLLAALAVLSEMPAHPTLAAQGVEAQKANAKPLAQPPEQRPQPGGADSATTGDTMVVHGRVLDPDGKPLAGAKVYLAHYTGKYNDKALRPEPRATSGAEGRFRFTFSKSVIDQASWLKEKGAAWPNAAIVAVAEGHGPQWARAGSVGAGELTLRLVKDDVPVIGRVLDLEGRPVAGASVVMHRILATPDEDLADFVKARGFGHSGAPRQLDPGRAGLPKTLTTGPDGRFRLTGVGRERLVDLLIEGPAIETVGVRVLTRRDVDVKAFDQPRLEGMMLYAEAPLVRLRVYGATFDHPVGPTKPVVGTVRERGTGKPLPGVRVFYTRIFTGESGRVYRDVEAVSDAAGRYRLVGLPKQRAYRLDAVPEGDAPYLRLTTEVGDTEGLTPLTVDFEMTRGVLVRGRLLDKERGEPARGTVYYRVLEQNPHLAELPGKRYAAHYQAAGDGAFRLTVLPGPGLLTAVAQSGRFLRARLDPADGEKGHDELRLGNVNTYRVIDLAKAPESFACDLELTLGRTLEGAVLGPDGKPLAGASVHGLDDWSLQAKTLSAATFTAVGLDPSRPRTLTFLHKEHKLAGRATVRGDEREPVTVRLGPWGTVTGRVLDTDGKPLVGGKVEVFRKPFPGESVLAGVLYYAHRPVPEHVATDRDGRFRLEGLVPGLEYQILVVKTGLPFARDKHFEDVTVPPGETKDLGEGRVTRSSDE